MSASPSAGQLHHFLVLPIGTDRGNGEIVDQRVQALQTMETDMPFPSSGVWKPQSERV